MIDVFFVCMRDSAANGGMRH